jgi:hypothetical protein
MHEASATYGANGGANLRAVGISEVISEHLTAARNRIPAARPTCSSAASPTPESSRPFRACRVSRRRRIRLVSCSTAGRSFDGGLLRGLAKWLKHGFREADDFANAIDSAITAIEAAVSGAMVMHVEPDDIVSLSGVAERVGRTKECVRLLATGQRGAGGLPPPLVDRRRTEALAMGGCRGMVRQSGRGVAERPSAAFIAALNGALKTRWRALQVSASGERAVVHHMLERDLALVAS